MTNRPFIPAAVLMTSWALALAPLAASACPSGAPMASSPSRAGGSSGGASSGDTGAAEGSREAAAAGAGLDSGDDGGPRRSDGQVPVAQEAGAIAGVAAALNNDAQSTSPETDRQTTATQPAQPPAAEPAEETESPGLATFYGQPWWTRVDDDPPASDPGPTGGDKGFWDTYFGPPTYPNAPSFVASIPVMASFYWRVWTQQDVYEDPNVNPRWKEWHDLPWYQRYLTEPPSQHLYFSGGGVRG